MGIEQDKNRFKEIIQQQRREDLSQFIQAGDLLGQDERSIQVPIYLVNLPEFEYDKLDKGGIGKGDGGTPDEGQPVGQPQPGDEQGDGDEEGDGDDVGDGSSEHNYYEMSPDEFAEELDDILDLHLEPKGKKVTEEREGDLTDIAQTGPDSTLKFEQWFKTGLKRKLSSEFDEDYVREALKVTDITPQEVFYWARDNNIPVSKSWIDTEFNALDETEKGKWDSFTEMEEQVERELPHQKIRREGVQEVPLRPEDKQYAYPEIEEEEMAQVVVVNIRDVSGSMRKGKRELVERVFSPLDWYLQGKYDNAEFVYIVHDSEAWEVDRGDFFGVKSGGGTTVSSAFELAKRILDEEYPWSEWNRYVFAAGDGENKGKDTKENVIPLLQEIDANLHAYIETKPNSKSGYSRNGTVGSELNDAELDNVTVATVNSSNDVLDAIKTVLNSDIENKESNT